MAGNTILTSSNAPVTSAHPNIQPISFDKGSTNMLAAKEEQAPTYLFSTYWTTRWGHTNPQHRYTSLLNRAASLNTNYFPFIADYADYDFRN